MSEESTELLECLSRDGYGMLGSVFDVDEIGMFAGRLSDALETRNEQSILRSRGQTYGSRNLLETFPQVLELLDRPRLSGLIAAVLGQQAGIVRALYFDKPPGRSWSLPWHKDRTIAVKRNDLPSDYFCKPTVKAAVPHVEAPESLLENMLTLRIHLDAMNDANGPLCVLPGSHRGNHSEHRPPVELNASIGDVLAMRPLLSHASKMPHPEMTSHRRVVHFEAARDVQLPDEYEWYSFNRVGDHKV